MLTRCWIVVKGQESWVRGNSGLHLRPLRRAFAQLARSNRPNASTAQRNDLPRFMVQFPAVLTERPATSTNPWNVLETFLSRGLGVIDNKLLSVVQCSIRANPTARDSSVIQDGKESGVGPAGTQALSVIFSVKHARDAGLVWDLYNIERAALAERQVFLLDLNLPNAVNKLHRTSSQILPTLRKCGRSLQFHNDGVSENDHYFTSVNDLFDSLVPHYLSIFDLTKDMSAVVSCRLMKTLCSRLGLAEPQQAFSGPWYIYCLPGTGVTISRFGDEKDKQLVIDAFRHLTQQDSYDGILRMVDPDLPSEIQKAHRNACRLMPTFHQAGLNVQLTDGGVDLAGQIFTTADSVADHFRRLQIFIMNLPEPAPSATAAETSPGDADRRLLDRLTHDGLGFSTHESPIVLNAKRIAGRSVNRSRPMVVTLSSQEDKERMLKRYGARRWALWDRGKYIRDPNLPIHVWRIHRLALRRLSRTEYDEEMRLSLRRSCKFTETGVLFGGIVCERADVFLQELQKQTVNKQPTVVHADRKEMRQVDAGLIERQHDAARIVDAGRSRYLQNTPILAKPTTAGLNVQLTDGGVDLAGQTFTTADSVNDHFRRLQIFIMNLPEPAPSATVAETSPGDPDRRLLDRLAHDGLGFPADESPIVLNAKRIAGRLVNRSRPMIVTLSSQEDKERLLKRYGARRWALWDRGIYIRDPNLPIHVWRIHRLALRCLSRTEYDEEMRLSLRRSCRFTETGVLFGGIVCERADVFLQELQNRTVNKQPTFVHADRKETRLLDASLIERQQDGARIVDTGQKEGLVAAERIVDTGPKEREEDAARILHDLLSGSQEVAPRIVYDSQDDRGEAIDLNTDGTALLVDIDDSAGITGESPESNGKSLSESLFLGWLQSLSDAACSEKCDDELSKDLGLPELQGLPDGTYSEEYDELKEDPCPAELKTRSVGIHPEKYDEKPSEDPSPAELQTQLNETDAYDNDELSADPCQAELQTRSDVTYREEYEDKLSEDPYLAHLKSRWVGIDPQKYDEEQSENSKPGELHRWWESPGQERDDEERLDPFHSGSEID